MTLKEYTAGSRFPGVIGRTIDVSRPAWPRPTRARPGAPNVLFIVLDDTGFGQLGCYGSPIATPNIDALAAAGLRFTNMHTTALCSPSRVVHPHRPQPSLEPHGAASPNGSTGYPGYDGYIPFENGFLSEILLQQGYNTYCVGKWHLAPEEHDVGGRARTIAGRSAAASSATTAFSAATRTSTTPSSCATTRRPSRRRRPKRATT